MISKIYDAIGTTEEGRAKLPQDLDRDIRHLFEKAICADTPPRIFFRADDIGPPSQNFTRMMMLFIKFKIPICLAVVPTWLTQPRWETMTPFWDTPELFCWHMHGYCHKNHETEGKKQEFGPARTRQNLEHELSRGLSRLESILGDQFFPVFTPPWNRCSTAAMDCLRQLGFKAVSRSFGSRPPVPEGFLDISVDVDLHTRKDKDARTGWAKLVKELERALSSGTCGIMLHHMRMNDSAFLFLEYLLEVVAGQKGLETVTYKDLVHS